MGMTPNEGLIMGTRCGDLDTGVLLHIANKEELSIEETSNLLNKKSGMLGISGISSDMRDIEDASENGNKRAQIALDIYAYRVKKYIGAYVAAIGGVDVIVFTGGIGENDKTTRRKILTGLEFLGIQYDEEKNNIRSKEAILTTPDSKVKVLVVPTNEELVIALDTYKLTSQPLVHQ
jgi:acetate kinase